MRKCGRYSMAEKQNSGLIRFKTISILIPVIMKSLFTVIENEKMEKNI